MKKLSFICILLFSVLNIAKAQTNNPDLNKSLDALRKCIFNENYEQLANYTHPEVIKMMGGKAKMIETTKTAMNKMKAEGFTYESLGFKNPSLFIRKDNDVQFTITQEIVMQTPKGRVLGEYSIIGISDDKGKNWVFIDTSGKTKDEMKKYLPFLSDKLILKPKVQRMLSEGTGPTF